MLVLHSTAVRVAIPNATGSALWIKPLSSDDRDACVLESQLPALEGETPESTNKRRDAAYYRALGRKALVKWEGIAAMGENGPTPIAVDDTGREILMNDPDLQILVARSATGLGLKVFESLEAAGNALSGSRGG